MSGFWALTWNTQPYLSSDDMGKDLYPFWMTLEGQWPCRGYYWQYGPAMLFYYAFWLLIGGVHLVSIRMGYSVLYLLSSILSYRTLRLFVSPPIAFLASLSFLIQGMVYPFYNFNHIGAIPFLLLSIFSLWKFFLSREIRWCYAGTAALSGMALVKWNMGVTAFFAFFAMLIFGGLSKRRHWILLPLIFGGTVFSFYRLQYWGCQASWLKDCLTANQLSVAPSPWVNFKHLIQWFLVWDRKRLWWVGLFLVFGILAFLGLRKKGWQQDESKLFPRVIGSLFLFGLFNTSDYFLVGHIYRFDFWSFPILVLLMGLAAEWAKFLFDRSMRILLGILTLIGVLALPIQAVEEAFAARIPERYLDFPRGKIYLVKETRSTVEAIRKATRFILENTGPGQEILTLPKDPLYCFLSGRRHALRQLRFEITSQISEQEEEEMIRELETKQVPLVLLSNRDESNPATAKGEIGHFGRTHDRKLGRYLFEHYREVQTFGTWETPKPRIDHAIKIFRRKS